MLVEYYELIMEVTPVHVIIYALTGTTHYIRVSILVFLEGSSPQGTGSETAHIRAEPEFRKGETP